MFGLTWTKTADELLPHCRPGQRTSFIFLLLISTVYSSARWVEG